MWSLAQTSPGLGAPLQEVADLPAPPTGLSLLIAAGLIFIMGLTIWWLVATRRRDRSAFADLSDRFGLAEASQPERARVEAALQNVFGEGPRIVGLLKRPGRHLNLFIARVLMPLYRVDEGGKWDEKLQESQRKVVVLAHGFRAPLPAFRIMPNNWALSTVRGKEANIFEGVMPFGYRNYVLGEDRDALRHLLGGRVQTLLRDNRHTTIDARDEYLAFYLQDTREAPRDLHAFIEHCYDIALAIGERARP